MRLIAAAAVLLALPAMAGEPDCTHTIRADQIEVVGDNEAAKLGPMLWINAADIFVDGVGMDGSEAPPCPTECAIACEGIGYTPFEWHGRELVTWQCGCKIARTCSGEPVLETPQFVTTTEGYFLCACVPPDAEKTCPTYALRDITVHPGGGRTFRVAAYDTTQQGRTDPLCVDQ